MKANQNHLSRFSFTFVMAYCLLQFGFTTRAEAQFIDDCTIQFEGDMPVCNRQFVTLSVPFYENATYVWEPDPAPGSQMPNEKFFRALETTTYQVSITDTISGEMCLSPLFELEVRPRNEVNFEQIQLTCTSGDRDNGNTAMVLAEATGEAEAFSYEWQISPLQIAPNNPALAIGLKAHLYYYLDIEDSFGCRQTDSVFTEAYPNPDIEISTDPETVYIQNPYVDFSFENHDAATVEVTSHFWNFGDESEGSELLTPRHLYTEEGEYMVILTVYNPQGCDTLFMKEVEILPIKLKIPNVFTPNGDGINDYFVITEAPPEELDDDENNNLKRMSLADERPLNDYFLRTSLVIFNRQGRKVYESTNYQNDWDGGNLKDGVYFYVLQAEGFKSTEVYKGSVTIMGSQNN